MWRYLLRRCVANRDSIGRKSSAIDISLAKSVANLNTSVESIDSDVNKLLSDAEYEELVPSNWRGTGLKKQVLLVMPRQKWGARRLSISDAHYLTIETQALVNTLPDMKVVDTLMLSTLLVTQKHLFGSGNFELLKQKVRSNEKITGVVFAIDMLNSIQMSLLESELGLQVFDRYSIVMNIFRSQAATKEAKLQIALAEIPYIRNNLSSLQKSGSIRQIDILRDVGGFGQTWIETRKMLLNERELKLKKCLQKVASNRELLRLNRQRKQLPVVAVVGYTNSGKTSIIKALTEDNKLVPKNQLFATLDVTVHSARLSSGLKVLFADTIGFISHIPTALVHAFRSTLSEICCADLIVHVSDASNPHHRLQEQTVYETLEEIAIPAKLRSTIIEVANKIDLLDSETQTEHKIRVSATEGTGLAELRDAVETAVIANTGRLHKSLRVSNGGPQYQWLHKNAAIRECCVDPEDFNYLLVRIYITIEAFEKFKHLFAENYRQIK